MDYRELPEEFLEKMKQFLGEEYPEYLASYEEEPRSGLRVNTGRLTPEQFLEMAQTADWNLKPVPWTKNGFYYQGERQASVVLRGTLLFAGTECDGTGGMAADQAGRPGSGFVRGTGR